MKSCPRFAALVLVSIALGASACRDPVWLPEFGVETSTLDPTFADDAAIGQDGDFVVSWSKRFTEYQVYARGFSASTVPLGASFPVDPDMNPSRRGGSMARDASGRYVIVWSENELDIWGQRWGSDGTPIGDHFQINTATPDSSSNPVVACDPSGAFVVAWTIESPDTDGGDAVVRQFDANGVPLGNEFRVHEHSPDSQIASGIAMSASNFVVTWHNVGSIPGAKARLFDALGAPITGDFSVNTSPLGATGGVPDVAMNATGDFVVVWADFQALRGRRFAADGQPLDNDFPIQAGTLIAADDPRVTSDSAGNFLATWSDKPPAAASYDVYGRFYSMNGDTASDAFLVNELTADDQLDSRPSLADNGSFVVAFTKGGSGGDVKGRKNGVHASPAIVMDPLPELEGPAGDTMGNGVFEPGESQVLRTAWINDSNEAVESIFGESSLFTGPPGADYTIDDDQAIYDVLPTGVSKSCSAENDCYAVTVSNPATRPVQHWDALFQEQTNMSLPHTWVLHMGESFPDVPGGNQFYRFIETLFHSGVTGGCVGGYCPTNPVTRAQMAVFLLKAKFGSAHVPPPCTGTVFTDVSCTGGPFDPWIEELAALQITGGCGGTNYCPGNAVTRQQMAVFLLKSLEGSTYVPPACSGVFDDVACPSQFADWIEDLHDRGITGGCSVAPLEYCPTNPNNRGQMAVFLVKTFGLVLYGG